MLSTFERHSAPADIQPNLWNSLLFQIIALYQTRAFDNNNNKKEKEKKNIFLIITFDLMFRAGSAPTSPAQDDGQ